MLDIALREPRILVVFAIAPSGVIMIIGLKLSMEPSAAFAAGATGAMSIIAERMLANKQKGMSAEENAADIEVFKRSIYTRGECR